MMNFKIVMAFVLAVIMTLPVTPVVSAETTPEATVVAHYKDITAVQYDRVRGIYGRDYSYDWNTNGFTFFKNYTTTPAPLSKDQFPGSIILDGNLGEDAWKEIKPFIVNLEPTHPWGGAIKSVSVQAINNGTWLFLAFQWADATESRQESPRIKRPEGGFLYNQTHYYSDDLYIGWWMRDEQPAVKPWFNAHFAGTTMGRVPWKNDPTAKANLWIFKPYWDDDGARGWPLDYLTPKTFRWGPYAGQPLFRPYPTMTETLLNSTASYYIGTGVTHVGACAFPARNTFPYDVRSSGKWKEGTWTLEVARPFKPHPQNEPLGATMRFEPGKLYWVFFGAADGQHGENEDVGAVSQWLTLSTESAPSPAMPAVFFVGVAVAVAVLAALVLLRLRRRKRAQA